MLAMKPKRIRPSERDEMRVLAQYLDSLGLLWCHVPNEGRRSAALAAEMRRQGLKAGVPDVLIFTKPPDPDMAIACRCVAIELKAPGGRASVAQRQWVDNLRREDCFARVCYGADDAIDWVSRMYSRQAR